MVLWCGTGNSGYVIVLRGCSLSISPKKQPDTINTLHLEPIGRDSRHATLWIYSHSPTRYSCFQYTSSRYPMLCLWWWSMGMVFECRIWPWFSHCHCCTTCNIINQTVLSGDLTMLYCHHILSGGWYWSWVNCVFVSTVTLQIMLMAGKFWPNTCIR